MHHRCRLVAILTRLVHTRCAEVDCNLPVPKLGVNDS